MTGEFKYLHKWTKPEHYFGDNPVDDYVLYTQTRDSDLVTQDNFANLAKEFAEYSYTWSASHFLCGWVEHLMLRGSVPVEVLERADKFLERLADYPILNEDTLSAREIDAAWESWVKTPLSGRMEICRRFGVSVFAARREDELPDADVIDYLVYGV